MRACNTRNLIWGFAAAFVAAMASFGPVANAQDIQSPKQTDLPNPYRLVADWPSLPESMNGGKWGELIRADIDSEGNIWVFHRCFNTEPAGSATCVGRTEPPILKFDPAGNLLTSFGEGVFAFPHGFIVDELGYVWATDANANETVLGMSARDANGVIRGHQVFKFSPSGEVLMTLGTKGSAGNGPTASIGRRGSPWRPMAISLFRMDTALTTAW